VKLHPTEVAGVFVVEPELLHDERGFFARTWDGLEFEQAGLDARIAQCSVSFNHREGTLRGMHYQVAPFEEAKLVRCEAGAIYDVALDLRPASETYRRWTGVELTAENRRALYIPPGCAHGFLTQTDDVQVHYQITAPYSPEAARGVRWNDPAFAIEWPGAVRVINERDRSYPDFDPAGVEDR
jgi:dTDP-4-dehydrorhamnose 3,5-epimerase